LPSGLKEGVSHVNEQSPRMLDGAAEPDAASVAAWIGSRSHKRWMRLLGFIEANYPGVFAPDWIFGGKKYGWGLRFKKSKSFCTLIPERNRLVIQIVFGRAECENAEKVLPELSPGVRDAYADATTYHDGKWLALVVDKDAILTDLERLFFIKRKPKHL